VAAVSPQLFARQDEAYRNEVFAPEERLDAMAITNRSRRLMSDWLDPRASADYCLSSDWDDRWRTGGSVDEVVEEAHLSPQHILDGIRRFAQERNRRLGAIKDGLGRLGV
jgi:transketolase